MRRLSSCCTSLPVFQVEWAQDLLEERILRGGTRYNISTNTFRTIDPSLSSVNSTLTFRALASDEGFYVCRVVDKQGTVLSDAVTELAVEGIISIPSIFICFFVSVFFPFVRSLLSLFISFFLYSSLHFFSSSFYSVRLSSTRSFLPSFISF